MSRLPLGSIILAAAFILVYFGLAQRLLDKMRISDKTALLIIAGLVVGSFIDIPIMKGDVQVAVNVGGALIPIGLAVYLMSKAGSRKEVVRTVFASLVTVGVIYFIGGYLMKGEVRDRMSVVDPLYVYPFVGGGIAYLFGRSRRAAFVAATMGVLGLDIIHYVWLLSTGTPGNVFIGGAGAFDSIVIAGLVAVLLAEVIGETRERLQGGPESKGRDSSLLKNLRGIDRERKDGEGGGGK